MKSVKEVFVVAVLEYWCAQARAEEGALGGNNVAGILQISHGGQFDGPQCKPESQVARLL